METIGYWILTAFLIWLAVHYWILPGKITDTVGKLIIAAFVIWLLGNIAYYALLCCDPVPSFCNGFIFTLCATIYELSFRFQSSYGLGERV